MDHLARLYSVVLPSDCVFHPNARLCALHRPARRQAVSTERRRRYHSWSITPQLRATSQLGCWVGLSQTFPMAGAVHESTRVWPLGASDHHIDTRLWRRRHWSTPERSLSFSLWVCSTRTTGQHMHDLYVILVQSSPDPQPLSCPPSPPRLGGRRGLGVTCFTVVFNAFLILVHIREVRNEPREGKGGLLQ